MEVNRTLWYTFPIIRGFCLNDYELRWSKRCVYCPAADSYVFVSQDVLLKTSYYCPRALVHSNVVLLSMAKRTQTKRKCKRFVSTKLANYIYIYKYIYKYI